MALFLRLRIQSLTRTQRHFSTILSSKPSTPLSSKEKTRAALSLLKSENDPKKIVQICQAASLIPETQLDRIAFSVAINKLSKSNNFSYIQQFLEDLRSSRSDLRSSERFAARSIVLYGQAGMIDDAIRTFTEYHKDVATSSSTGSVKCLNALLFAFILAKNFKEVNRVFLEFPRSYRITPNLDTYNTVIKAFSESESPTSGYSILAEMDGKGVKPNATTFGNLIIGFYREEKYEDVAKVLTMMKDKYGVHQGIGTYNIRIQSLCKLKMSAKAEALLDEILARNMKPNSETYHHLILGFCVEGNLEEAKSLYDRMVSRGCEPDADCYFTLVGHLCKAGDFETALKFCNMSIDKGWIPNFATMKSLVNGLASAGRVTEAKNIVGQMKKRFVNNNKQWEEIEASLP